MNSTPSPADVVVAAAGVTKIYRRGNEQVRALVDASFTVSRGEFVAIEGPSGSGKTTLLNLLGCMDAPTSGSLRIAGEETTGLVEAARTRLRRRHIGFVFQHFGLVPTLTVAENVALPALFARREAGERVGRLLDRVGLGARSRHRPHELSGGEMQRVAIARALVNEPALLLADEPTGNLDSATGESILDLFRELNRGGVTLIVVTHNPGLAAVAGRRLVLRDGRLVRDAGDPVHPGR